MNRLNKFTPANDLAHVFHAARDPRPVFRPLYEPTEIALSARISSALMALLENQGFTHNESATITRHTMQAARKTFTAEKPLDEHAAAILANILAARRALPVIERADGEQPSDAWGILEATPRWAGKPFNAARSA